MGPLTVVWFRRDLRVADMAPLRYAADRGPVVCLWVLDPAIVGRRHHDAPVRRSFLRAGLEALDAELREIGSRLVVRVGDPRDVIPAVAGEVSADEVVWSAEVSPLGRARDRDVTGRLGAAGVGAVQMPHALHAQPEDLPGPSGEGYRVFTAFWRGWAELPIAGHEPGPGAVDGPELVGEPLDMLAGGAATREAGPAAARDAIVAFIRSGAADRYGARRDVVAEHATSELSAYLRFGMCTTAQIGRALGLPGEVSAGRLAVWRQLCWREFYAHHLLRNPRVARTAFREDLRNIDWNDDDAGFAAWQAGRTGYPLVDAAMRQLARTGWVHNRARMVAASFLVKDLLIDWRRGETVFMQRLIDGDPANNNGGWQWVAGTGTDAAPYFRVLNPILQAKRFDPDGEYVRRYVPELAGVPTRWIFEPWRMSDADQRAAGCVIGTDYPAPIVDHAVARRRTLERYGMARAATAPDG